ncbi:hypothetical protein GOV06_03180 [Candidatus Woesearchaeota archaeon]|nr:hypothetical protein [Candidatus Woesearchaeota archaeon]
MLEYIANLRKSFNDKVRIDGNKLYDGLGDTFTSDMHEGVVSFIIVASVGLPYIYHASVRTLDEGFQQIRIELKETMKQDSEEFRKQMEYKFQKLLEDEKRGQEKMLERMFDKFDLPLINEDEHLSDDYF